MHVADGRCGRDGPRRSKRALTQPAKGWGAAARWPSGFPFSNSLLIPQKRDRLAASPCDQNLSRPQETIDLQVCQAESVLLGARRKPAGLLSMSANMACRRNRRRLVCPKDRPQWVPVLNPKNLRAVLKNKRGATLSDNPVKRIVHQKVLRLLLTDRHITAQPVCFTLMPIPLQSKGTIHSSPSSRRVGAAR